MPPAAAAGAGLGVSALGTVLGATQGRPDIPNMPSAQSMLTPEGRQLLQAGQTAALNQVNQTPDQLMSRSNAAFSLRQNTGDRQKRMDQLMRQRLNSMPGTVGGAAPQMQAGGLPGVIGGTVPPMQQRQ